MLQDDAAHPVFHVSATNLTQSPIPGAGSRVAQSYKTTNIASSINNYIVALSGVLTLIHL